MKVYSVKTDNLYNFGFLVYENELKIFLTQKYLSSSRDFMIESKINREYPFFPKPNEAVTSSIENLLNEKENRVFKSGTWIEHKHLPGEFYPSIFRPALDLAHYEHGYYGDSRYYPLEQLL